MALAEMRETAVGVNLSHNCTEANGNDIVWLMRLALLFTFLAFPLLELALLIKVGQHVGVWGVLLLIVGTAALGMVAVRRHGLAIATDFARAAERGRLSERSALQDALVVLAGLLLLAPGLITDTVGLLLLIPVVRKMAASRISRSLFSAAPPAPSNPEDRGGNVIIEGEFERVEERDAGPP